MTWKILLVLFVFVIFWGGGFMMQREQAANQRNDYYVTNKSRWVRLFGLSSATGRVYIRYAFLQMIGLLYLVIGLLLVGCCNQRLFDMVTAWFFLILFGGAIVFGFFDIFGKR